MTDMDYTVFKGHEFWYLTPTANYCSSITDINQYRKLRTDMDESLKLAHEFILKDGDICHVHANF